MGGASYDRDSFSADETESGGSSSFSGGYDRFAASQGAAAPTSIRELVKPLGRSLDCLDDSPDKPSTPIVVAFDVTRSRGDDVKIIFDKLPMLIGQAIGKNYVENPKISFCAIGDATDGDKAPLQVGSFQSDTTLDTIMANMWLEKGGGGSGQESYELAAYMYARHSRLDSLSKRGEKGYFFFIGDEGFYPAVSAPQVSRIIGDSLTADIPTKSIFDELREKYEVFYIFPRKSWQERKADIDAEIRGRVVSAGGQYDNVDLRASLLWNTRDDLDLHCECPDGHIYFNNKVCGSGALDVDRNVSGETTKPIENIRWPKGTAREGRYRFYVNYYSQHDSEYHSAGDRPIPYTVELENNGEVQSYKGELLYVGNNSNVATVTFIAKHRPVTFIAKDRPVNNAVYSGYDDRLIRSQWETVLPEDHILLIENPKAIVDVILGALAVSNGITLATYIQHLELRGQTPERCSEVSESLGDISSSMSLAVLSNTGLSASDGPAVSRRGKSRRL